MSYFKNVVNQKLHIPEKQGGGQSLKKSNVKWPLFRISKTANIKIAKDELFNIFIFEFILLFFRNYFNTLNIWQFFYL